jgi:hypothetical protein
VIKTGFQIVFLLGVLGCETALTQASTYSSQVMAPVVAYVPAYIVVSGPVIVTIDLQEHPLGTPISAQVQFSVRANTQEVELQVACTDLYEAGDPTSAHRIPVAGAGAQITCEHGQGIIDSAPLLSWQDSPPAGLLPAGWTGAVSEIGIFTAAPASIFTQNVTVDVSWNTTDANLPVGEYKGIVTLIGMVRP